MTSDQLANFERAFSDSTAGCRRTCNCGVTYYDSVQSYDWEGGELEKLRADPKAVALDYAPGDLSFEGYEYVDACTCWHKRAEAIFNWIESHGRKIAKLLNLEKGRKTIEAQRSPSVQ